MAQLFSLLMYLLAFIAILNIGGSLLFTIVNIEKYDESKNKLWTALYFAFTIIGIYAMKNLLK